MALEAVTIKDSADQDIDITVDVHDTDQHAQVVKLGFGADGTTPTLVSSSNPLPIADAGGSLTVDGSVSLAAAIPAGANNIGDVDVLTVPADPFGANADAAVAAGAAGSIQAKLRRATQGLEDLKSLIVLAAGDNNIGNVDVVSLPSLPAGTNNIGDVDVLSVVPGTGATALGKAEDAAHVSGDTGVAALAVRRDAAAAGSGTDGDYSTLNVDGSGRLWVNGSGVTQPVSDGGGSLTVDGTVAVSGTVPVTDNGGSLTVDGSVSIGAALPAGANNIGDVDVLTVPADPFGANADAAVAAGASGSIQAKLRRVTQGLEDLKSLIVLAAGDNNIGNVDIVSLPALPSGSNNIGDVDVLTQPARARTTDTISAALATDVVMAGTTAKTPVSIVISAASSGDNTLLAAQGSGNKIRILQLVLIAAGTVNVRLESAAGGTAMSGVMSLIANTGFVLPFSPIGWGDTAGNALLNLELSAAIQVSGILTYVVVT